MGKEAQTKTTKWRFDLDVGQEAIDLPKDLDASKIFRVCLLDLRNRPINLMPMELKDVKDMGRKFVFDVDQKGPVETPLKGFPLYYINRGRRLLIWPVPAHAWSGFIEEKASDSHENQ